MCVHEFMLVRAHTHVLHVFRGMKIPKEAIRYLTSRVLGSYDKVAKSQNPVLCKSTLDCCSISPASVRIFKDKSTLQWMDHLSYPNLLILIKTHLR